MKMYLPMLLRIAGIMHFGLLLASFSVPRVLGWQTELKKVSSLTRQLVLVHGGFIVLTIIAFGLVTLVAGPELLAGNRLALSVTLFIGVFWTGRLLIQVFYFDAEPWLSTCFRRIGYRALYLVFAYFALAYLAAAWLNVSMMWNGR
jgi:hypothetical protein